MKNAVLTVLFVALLSFAGIGNAQEEAPDASQTQGSGAALFPDWVEAVQEVIDNIMS